MSIERPPINSSVPHSARIWNYWLGGKDCYEIDRQVGDQIAAANPGILETARAQRAFLVRAVEYLVRDAGIRQFLDVGTGLPTADNTHEVAQRLLPEARIVYVDHDPVVLVHAQALLTSTPEGATDYIDADLRNPEQILEQAAKTLDFTQPVALVLLGIAAHVTDDSAYDIVDRLVDALPSGSYLVFCDSTDVIHPEQQRAMVEQWNEASDNPRVNRSPEELARFFDGLELLEPGLLSTSRWRPESNGPEEPAEVDNFGGVARKP
ncbi:O-methyltransferase involved in polyketide biosynthesis [Streptomyces griseochromogenes]|uniref:O-methyltransferase involved in polyketide biosynthesis n=1 Tax=Streptomyces griseochromogenes TaxID=68214 RepID=A0A1B1B452_9ACTN|nr:SAM-dependent methyltransferase [Streptomyces griseochromogenes]ANP53593.1 S-adenosyl methyltransferase [Streptomyces griseochromogenes]MBP2055398.1 O-methyltransferase involved in polyketide biosynthesis [Streptomyces griseochromogenes]